MTKSLHGALADLNLDRAWIAYPGTSGYPANEKASVCPLNDSVAEFAAGRWAK